MIHSTSLRPTGSAMVAAIAVALLETPLRTLSIALRTRAAVASEVSGVADFSG